MKLSVVIITKNEERNLARCLESVKFADEIILIDSNSTDRTVEIAKQFNAKVYPVEFCGYGPAKRKGTDIACGQWILSLDADEEVSDELASEIRELINGSASADGYYISRRTNFLGRWINHSGWYPDRVLRLFRKDKGNFNKATVHEEVILKGRSGKARGELRHFSYPDMETYLEKSNRYTTMGAQKAFGEGRQAGWYDLVVRPLAAFVKHYLTGQGFRDGKEGFIISVMSSIAVLVKYAKLRAMHKTEAGREKQQNE